MTSSVSVVCSAAEAESGWGTATPIETNSLSNAADPQIAVDGSGNAIAVWHQHDGIRISIWSNRYVVGAGWETATLVETDIMNEALYPQVAIDSSGNAIAVWEQSEGILTSIWSNRYVVGTGWGTATLIETDDAGYARRPQVGVDGSSNAIAAWSQWDGTQYSIYSNRYVVGTGWGIATLIETDSAGGAFKPQVAVDSSGNAIAVWVQSDGIRDNVWSNRYVVGTGWGTATLIEADNAGHACDPQVAVDGSGDATAVWHQYDGTRYNVWSNRYVVGTGWGTATLIEADNAGHAYNPQVAVDGPGNATAVWYQWDDTCYSIWSNRYVVGTGWGTATLIEADNAGSAFYPQVAVDSSGNAIAVWDQWDGTRYNIWVNRYVVDTGWGTTTLIETDNAGDAFKPQVAVDSSGNAIAVWCQYDAASVVSIWSNRYVEPDTTPPPLSLVTPADGLTTETPVVTASGTTEPGVSLVVNGISVAVESDGSFSCEIALLEGENTITATATDASDNSATVSVSVTYINPIDELEEELEDTRDELVDIRDELNGTQDELDSLEDDMVAALEELSSTQDELDAAEDELAVVQDELDGTQDELDSLEDDLETTQDELDATQEELDSLEDDLETTQAELNATGEELDALEGDLNAAEEELTSTSDDLESMKSQNTLLMAVLAIVAILAVVMAVMFLSLRKKIAGMEVKAVEEEPPPPQS